MIMDSAAISSDAGLKDLENQAFRYDAQDGITEFLAGILFFFVARSVVDPHLAWVPALLVFPLRFALRFFKRRFIYPRAGLVQLKGETGREFGQGVLLYLLGVLAAAAGALWIFGDITSWDMWMKWMPAIMAGFTAGGFIYLAGKTGFLRHRFLVVFCLGWGVACSLLSVDSPRLGMQRWALGLGLVCLLMGVAVFLNFLRTHPARPAEVADGQA
jgi:hypothetical protein